MTNESRGIWRTSLYFLRVVIRLAEPPHRPCRCGLRPTVVVRDVPVANPLWVSKGISYCFKSIGKSTPADSRSNPSAAASAASGTAWGATKLSSLPEPGCDWFTNSSSGSPVLSSNWICATSAGVNDLHAERRSFVDAVVIITHSTTDTAFFLKLACLTFLFHDCSIRWMRRCRRCRFQMSSTTLSSSG